MTPFEQYVTYIWRKLHRGITIVKSYFTSRLAKLNLKLWGVHYGKGLRIHSSPLCRRHPEATITLGSHVTILNRISENPAGISHPTVLSAYVSGARIEIGNHVGISGAIIYCMKEIVIEDHVMIGAGAKIYDTDFHPIQALPRRNNDREKINRAPVRICRDAWIGADATILKGVVIGARSVVAAGAVVTKDVPPDTIVAGIPAREIGKIDNHELGKAEN